MDNDEQVAIFLYAVGGNHSNRATQERFQRSADTVSRAFNGVLRAILHLQPQFMSIPTANTPAPPELQNHQFKWFENCLGALDGTHVSACVNETAANPYRNRKGFLSQNVLGVCGFNMLFHFVYAGWEGSAHDGRVLEDAQRHGFTIPAGKFYLGDGGYSLTKFVLVPFRGVRYHLKEFAQLQNQR